MTEPPNEITYKLGKTPDPRQTLSAVLTPSGQKGEWLLQIRAQSRGKKGQTALLESSASCPLATITLAGETFPLPITRHARKRGGILCLGGTRKTGTDGSAIEWEMRWLPDPSCAGRFTLETRVRATSRRAGDLRLFLQTRLHAPCVWTLGAGAQNGHCAQLVYSKYSAQAILFTALASDAGWDDDAHCFTLASRRFALGGGRCLRAQIAFLPAPDQLSSRAALVSQYAEGASSLLHPCPTLPELDPLPAAEWLSEPAHYAAPGVERLYLALPSADSETVQSGAPHFPLDALHALAQWDRFHPNPDAARLVRYGAMGIAADFQVMGRANESEPNKGAFWDQATAGRLCDEHGQPAHGIAANARIARSLFLLHETTHELLLRQSALNICQWLILKMNADGWFDGAHVYATEGRSTDGRVIPQPCALDGAEAIHPFVLAFRATRNEVFIKAAGKLAAALLPRMAEFDACPPPVAASVLRALLALDAEAPQPRLRAAIASWAAWLRMAPLCPASPALNADGQHSGLYDCAQAGFALFAHTRDLGFLRYALHALSLVPPSSRGAAWRMMASCQAAPLSLAALLPDSRIDFDRRSVSLDWRTYAPDPATEQHIQVRGSGNQPVCFLPLVCRASDQLLLLILAPPTVPAVTILKNGRRPLACDLLSGTFDTDTILHAPSGLLEARVGLFTIDP